MDGSTRVVHVEIHGQRYPDPQRARSGLRRRAGGVRRQKMQLAAMRVPAGRHPEVAVLAALNIADEMFRARDEAGIATRGSPSAPGSSSACSIWRSAEEAPRGIRRHDAPLDGRRLTTVRSSQEFEFPALRVMVRRLV